MKLVKISLFTLSVILSLFIVSCEKETVTPLPAAPTSTTTSNDPASSNLTTAPAIYGSMINTAAFGLLDLSLNANFRNAVHTMAMQQFDGDYNVLLKAVEQNAGTTLSLSLASEFASSINQHFGNLKLDGTNPYIPDYQNTGVYNTSAEIIQSIRGFVGNDQKNFIQIYVPNMEGGSVDPDEVPIIALAFGDDCTTFGYQYSSDGNWQVVYVDEALAHEHLVWVVSVNETVYSDQTAAQLLESGTGIGGDSGATGDRAPRKEAHISAIKIFDKKECWLCGKADVTVVGAQVSGECSNIKGFGAVSQFIKIGNSDLGVEKVIPSSNGQSYLALDPEKPLFSNDRLGFIIYEKDNFNWQTHNAVQNCNQANVSFKSQNSVYGFDKDVKFVELPNSATFTLFSGLSFTSPDGSATCKVNGRLKN